MDCIRCGTPTERPPFSYDTIQKTDPLKNFTDIEGREVNGVIWLCDGCIEDLKDFLLGKEIPTVDQLQ